MMGSDSRLPTTNLHLSVFIDHDAVTAVKARSLIHVPAGSCVTTSRWSTRQEAWHTGHVNRSDQQGTSQASRPEFPASHPRPSEHDSPPVNDLIYRQQDQVQVLQHRLLLNLLPAKRMQENKKSKHQAALSDHHMRVRGSCRRSQCEDGAIGEHHSAQHVWLVGFES